MNRDLKFDHSHPRWRQARRRGVALVVVLAFVVLLIGVLLAFFSQSLLQRQVAQSSSHLTRVDVFAQGALETLIGDLRQEILAGSSATNAGGATIYFPSAITNMTASRVGTTDALPNLVKRTVNGQAFFPGGPIRASSVSSANASPNGRHVSVARWNNPYLLPKASPNSASDRTPVAVFLPPDWVYVDRAGSNAIAWSSALRASGSANNTQAVVGRFASAVYDEGGLLDVNVAGYPTALAATNSAYKSALALADLSVVGLTPAQIDALVGWRGFASGQPGGTFPNLAISAANATNWLKAVRAEANGFLRPANTILYAGQSDRLFGSRQQLIHFLLQGVAQDDSQRAAVQNALQYLGTFSRDLNQPSFRPDPNRPKILAANSGGNDSTGGDDIINPSFLTVRVGTPFTRNDGSTAFTGEPLVKRRFALNRLAWLTYQGPSASRNMSDPDMQRLQSSGLTTAFLSRGTAANIQKHFGLTWDSANTRWTYANGASGAAPIRTLENSDPAKSVRAAGRDAEFVELLKAAAGAGTLAKPATTSAAGTDAYAQQYARDVSLDYATMQMAANIIDQFDTDGYPTRIAFDGREFRGIENLPYVNRLRAAVLKAVEPVPAIYGRSGPNADQPQPKLNTGGNLLTDTGVGVVLYYPEVWNPHDWNAANLAQTVGAVAPTNFQITAESTTFTLMGYVSDIVADNGVTAVGGNSDSAKTSASPGFASVYGFSFSPPLRSFTESTTAMTFSVPLSVSGLALFREPTLLFKPNIPAGSALAAPGLSSIVGTEKLTPFVSGDGGIRTAVADTYLGDPPTQGYIGFYAGVLPLRWVRTTGTNDYNLGARQPRFGGTVYVTLRIKYLDASGAWVTYDEKVTQAAQPNDQILVDREAGQFNPKWKNMSWSGPMDPRTSRFGMTMGVTFNGYSQMQFPGFENGQGWVDKPNGVVSSQRNGLSSGATSFSNPGSGWSSWWFPAAMGWHPGSASWLSEGDTLRPGLLSQNNPSAANDGRAFDGAAQSGYYASASQYYADPDGVVRRAAGAYVPTGATPATTTVGLPMAIANTAAARTSQSDSRPIILNRPFLSVAELGATFSGTPWKNVSFFTPESGMSALLDVFCLADSGDPDGLIAGRLNLNTRQAPVLQAVLAGAYMDERNPGGSTLGGGTGSLAEAAARALVNRTTSAAGGPLRNVAELVGRWDANVGVGSGGIDGSQSFSGFSGDLSSVFSSPTERNIQRFRESAIRPLVGAGTTRVWNLFIDLIAQTGRFSPSAGALDQFTVEGETRFWLHVAIDRLTGEVLDKHLEVVKE